MKGLHAAINLRKLYQQLGYKSCRVPFDYSAVLEQIQVPLLSGESRTMTVIIYQKKQDGSRKPRANRAYVLCPTCGEEMPAGRLHLHEGNAECLRRASRLEERCQQLEEAGWKPEDAYDPAPYVWTPEVKEAI